MFYDNSEVEFPNWWDALNGGTNGSVTDSSESGEDIDCDDAGRLNVVTAGLPKQEEQDQGEVEAEADLNPDSEGYGCGGGCPLPDYQSFSGHRYPIGESLDSLDALVAESAGTIPGRGYDRDVVHSVWEFAEVVHGNDPDLWRKDEFGNWIYRLDYGRRGSEFGWEVFDPGVGRHSQGVYAMRPMQWQSYIRQYEVMG
tara:strand:- start:817 stop:1410 length:594 start_codon:yes stop_codon:yes gene_type:complete